MRKITAKFFEADKEAGTRAGWQFHREGDRLPALELAHLSKTATDAEIAEQLRLVRGDRGRVALDGELLRPQQVQLLHRA